MTEWIQQLDDVTLSVLVYSVEAFVDEEEGTKKQKIREVSEELKGLLIEEYDRRGLHWKMFFKD